MSMTRLVLTDAAFHGGEPLPRGARAGALYPFIPSVTAPPVPTAARDAPAGEVAPTTLSSPAGLSSSRARDP